ncbi:DUF202 domain-containing protein [Polynucleobacter sp. MWH-UH23A]|uniref:YidH family protein n=1 Tax=Polynucleobacter sp. MWH-UH23A TaxID=1855613 RepID=UPI003364F393
MNQNQPQLDNPQVFFAAERTLLAWQRSSISFIALGFVIERFGLFIRFLKLSNDFDASSIQLSAIVGIIFIGIGSTICLLTAIQYQLFLKTLSPREIPSRYFAQLAPIVSYLIFFIATGLGTWLGFSS